MDWYYRSLGTDVGTIQLLVPTDDPLSMILISSYTGRLLANAPAFATSRAETTTYVDGNLTSVSPNTGSTLLFSDENSLRLQHLSHDDQKVWEARAK